MPQTDLVPKFKNQVQKSLLLTDEDKQYWLQNADKLPGEVVEQVYGIIKTDEELVQSYIQTAMRDDPKLLTELKTKINKIKKGMMATAEQEQQPKAEEELEEKLKQV